MKTADGMRSIKGEAVVRRVQEASILKSAAAIASHGVLCVIFENVGLKAFDLPTRQRGP